MYKKSFMRLFCLLPLAILFFVNPSKAAITTWYFEQMSSGRAYLYDLEYGISGNPGFVTFDYNNNNVNYTYKTSSGWQTELVGTGSNSEPCLEYDSTGKACVLYLASGGLKYAVRIGSNNWQTSTVDTVAGSDYIEGNCSFEFNGTQPCVSYVKTVFTPYYSPDLYFASFNGTVWQKQVVDTVNDIGYPSISFNAGKPGIAYDGGHEGLKYAAWNGSAWVIESVDLPADFGGLRNRYYNITLAYGKGTPYISYYDMVAYDLKYAYKIGSAWTVTTLESSGDVGGEAKMAISESPDDYMIYIAYNNFVINQNSRIMLKSMSGVNDTEFKTEVVYTKNFGNVPPYLGLAFNGNPCVAFFDYWGSKTTLATMQPDIATDQIVNFGVVSDDTSNTRNVTVTNNGSVYLSITQVDLPAAPFVVTGSLGAGLDSGESKVLTVGFNPGAVGTAYQDNIVIHSNDPDESVFTIALNGRTYSNNANLSGLSLNIAGSPAFDPGVTEYSLTVPYSTGSIRVTPTSADPYAVIKVKGVAVQSGAASGDIALNVGLNSIPVLVTAEGGLTEKTYTLNITRKDSPNANLSGLAINGGSLSLAPAFSQDTTAYTVTLEDVAAITLSPAAAESRSVITVNGEAVTSGSATPPIPVAIGTSTITVRVLAPDRETSRDYTLTVRRMPALSGLALSGGELVPHFDRDINEYAATVPNAIDKITVAPVTPEDLPILVNAETVASGSESGEISLAAGENVIIILVKSPDLTLNRTYTLKVTRRPCLSSLSLSAGELDTSFDSGILEYQVTVPNNISDISIIPEAASGTDIKVNGNPVASGAGSASIALNAGSNTVNIETVSADGKASENYSLVIKRLPALAGLALSTGTLDFDAEVFTYLINVPNNITDIKLIPTVAAGIKIKVNGNSSESGAESPAITLAEGINTITVEVISADDKAASTYQLTVKRLSGLDNLSMSTGTLEFISGTFDYEVTVPNDTSKIRLTAEAPEGISIRINGDLADSGAESPEITLGVGKNVINIEAVSGDEGSTVYTLAVKRLPALSYLSVNGEEIGLVPGTTEYEVTEPNAVNNIIIAAEAADGIIIKIDGSTVESGAESPAAALHEGSNTFIIETVSADGETNAACTLTVIRLPALSSLSISTGTLTPEFDPGSLIYTVNLPNAIDSITLTPVSMEPGSLITVNEKVVSSGTASEEISISLGRNDAITIKVTSQDGKASSSYKLSIYRAYPPAPVVPSHNADVTGSDTATTLPVEVDNSSGRATVNLDPSAGVLGGTETGGEIPVISVPPIPGMISYTLELPASALTGGKAGSALIFSTEAGSIAIPGNMLGGITGTASDNAGITVGQGDKSLLTDEVRQAIGDRPVIQLTMTVDGERKEWSNPNAPVTVSIPYTPTAEELKDPEHIVVWYIDGAGNTVSVPSGRYDPATGKVTFATTHFSYYAITYVTRTYDDIASVSWAKKPVEALASKGILRGITENKYAPGTNITRADFMYFLIRTLGMDAEVDGNFDDIDKGDYYWKEIGIAKKLGITSGIGKNKFNPDASITRQDMMVLTEKALRMLNVLKIQGAASDLKKFTDRSLVAGYAVNSVASIVKEGLIVGSGGKINPLGNTTRAEAAVILYKIYNKY